MSEDARAMAIGHIADGAAKLELFLTTVLAGAIAAGQAGTIVAGESFSWIASKLEALAKTRSSDPRCGPFLAALSQAKRAYNRRNQILHAAWSVGAGETAERYKWTRGAATYMSGESMTPADLEEVAQAITLITAQLLHHLEFLNDLSNDVELHGRGGA